MTEQAQHIGERGIGVQISGDGNSVTIYAGAAELVLDLRHKLKARPETERDLLLTELRATTLVGRDGDLAQLDAWLNTSRFIAVRGLTGRAGTGKTRLAIEFCERAEAAGWTAGFARHDVLQRFSAWRWNKPTLVVVDDAAASANILRQWLEVLARRPRQENDHPLRLLLLERYAEPGMGWWDQVFKPASLTGRGPDDLLDPAEPVKLNPLATIADRRALLAQVMAEAARLKPVFPAPQPPAPGANPAFDQRLADDRIDNEPLFLAMAGIVAVATGAPAALALGATELAGRIAASEQTRLEHLAAAHGIAPTLFTHLAACVTLQNGCTQDAAEAIIREEPTAMRFPPTTPPEQIANHLRAALPSPIGAGIDAIRPDLIGEAFLLRELGREQRPPARQAEIVQRAFVRAGMDVVRTVLRTAQDHCAGANNHPSLLWLDHLTARLDDPFALMAIADELPQQTVGLRERAAYILTDIVTKLRKNRPPPGAWSRFSQPR